MKRMLIVCTTDSMIWNFLVPHVKEFEKHGWYVECVSSITGSFFQDLEKVHSIKMNEIPFERSPYKVNNIKAYGELVKLIKKKNFDTIFCHEPVGGAMGRLAGHHCGCKVIYMAHGFHFFHGAPKSRKLYYYVEKFLSRYTDTLITINQEDYDASLEFYAKRNYKINGIGVNTEVYQKVEEYMNYLDNEFFLPQNAVKILSVGELIERKNHKVVIEALAKLKNPNIFYFIAGDGKMKCELQRMVGDLGLSKNVIMLGYRTDIDRLCNSADIFAFPSVHEGLSVALMEAMACGKPVVCSKIRGNTDLIVEDKGGYLVSTFDVDEYSRRICSLVNNKKLMNEMGIFNMNHVKKFDITSVKVNMFEIINEG